MTQLFSLILKLRVDFYVSVIGSLCVDTWLLYAKCEWKTKRVRHDQATLIAFIRLCCRHPQRLLVNRKVRLNDFQLEYGRRDDGVTLPIIESNIFNALELVVNTCYEGILRYSNRNLFRQSVKSRSQRLMVFLY